MRMELNTKRSMSAEEWIARQPWDQPWKQDMAVRLSLVNQHGQWAVWSNNVRWDASKKDFTYSDDWVRGQIEKRFADALHYAKKKLLLGDKESSPARNYGYDD